MAGDAQPFSFVARLRLGKFLRQRIARSGGNATYPEQSKRPGAQFSGEKKLDTPRKPFKILLDVVMALDVMA